MSEQRDLFVGLILDGNRRWAEQNGVDIPTAYREGARRVKEILGRARDERVIKIMAIFGLSCSNMDKRSGAELSTVCGIIAENLTEMREWLEDEENKSVRLLHMGQRQRMEKDINGTEVLRILDEVAEETKLRNGMVIALALDYEGRGSGAGYGQARSEEDRAHAKWVGNGCPGGVRGWKWYLDLPRKGVPYRHLDVLFRTGVEPGSSDYDNEFLCPYFFETRRRFLETLFPDFTADMFSRELHAFLGEQQKRGR